MVDNSNWDKSTGPDRTDQWEFLQNTNHVQLLRLFYFNYDVTRSKFW